MYGVAIIVCTNNLWDGVKEDSDEGDWIKKNCVNVYVDKPLWIEE